MAGAWVSTVKASGALLHCCLLHQSLSRSSYGSVGEMAQRIAAAAVACGGRRAKLGDADLPPASADPRQLLRRRVLCGIDLAVDDRRIASPVGGHWIAINPEESRSYYGQETAL